jgi:transposase InsO family protein
MERCIKSIKEELGPLANYQDIDELYVGVANAISYYTNERIHLSLKMSPAAYAASLPTARSTNLKLRRSLRLVFGKRGA